MGQHAASSKARPVLKISSGPCRSYWCRMTRSTTCLLPFRSRYTLNSERVSLQTATKSRSVASGTATPSTPTNPHLLRRRSAPKRRSSPPRARSPRDKAAKRRRGRTAALVALVGVIVLAAAAVVWFTDGFGLWTRPGPVIKPVSATVFSPSGAPDNPQKADLAIDGNPDTSWSTVTYKDPVPFPNFIEGEGLLLHLSEPTALSAVTIDLSSTGTEVQILSSPTETPAKLADTTELTPTTPLQPGHNRIEVHDRTKTSNVLVWISKLGTTDGQSRTEISEITLQAAA